MSLYVTDIRYQRKSPLSKVLRKQNTINKWKSSRQKMYLINSRYHIQFNQAGFSNILSQLWLLKAQNHRASKFFTVESTAQICKWLIVHIFSWGRALKCRIFFWFSPFMKALSSLYDYIFKTTALNFTIPLIMVSVNMVGIHLHYITYTSV